MLNGSRMLNSSRILFTFLPLTIRRNMKNKTIVSAVLIAAVILLGCGKAPVACFTVDKGKLAKLNEEVQFDAACSADAESFEWNFGDGTAFVTGATVKHKFTIANTYTVVLTAKSGNKIDTAQAALLIAP
jgi:PKD repeat protein